MNFIHTSTQSQLGKLTVVNSSVFGAASALGEALSFLTDDPIVMTTTNSLTKSVVKQAVNIDNNLDGDFTDNDS